MAKRKKLPGHYCKICGRRRPNEKFSGSGHAAHICKDCAKMPVDKRKERMIINRIYSLPFRLKKEQRSWLETMRKDPREEVRAAAESAYDERYGWIEEQRRIEDEIEVYLDSLDDEILSYGEYPAYDDAYPGYFEKDDDINEVLPFE